MDRQLFSQTSRVSTKRSGAVPVSMALHAMVIGGAVFATAAMSPPLPDVQPPHTRIAVVLPSEPVRVDPPPPPKGLPRPPAPPRKNAKQPPPSVAPAPATQSPVPDNVNTDLAQVAIDQTESLPFETGNNVGPVCVGCAIGPATGSPDGVPNATGPIRVSGLNAPTRIHFVKPVYPPLAISAHAEGEVLVDCVIAPNGQVREARVLSGHPLLKQASLDAVRQWRYTPPRLNDTPISVLLTVTVHFRLQR